MSCDHIIYIAYVSINIYCSLLLAAILPSWHPRHGTVHLSLLKNKQIPNALHTYSYTMKGIWREYDTNKLLGKQFVKWCFETCDSCSFVHQFYGKNLLHSVSVLVPIMMTQQENNGISNRQHSKFYFTTACSDLKSRHKISNFQGAVSIRKTVLPGMAIPMLKIRRPNGRLIFNMEITIHR